MSRGDQLQSVLRFGAFELDTRSGELRKRGLRIKLQGQPLQILTMLLESPGEIVLRDELRAKLWPTDTFVDFDQGLNKAINRLRAALGDSAGNPRFIETIPRRGYRMICPTAEAARGGPVYAAPEPRQIRLAILPLENLSGDPLQEYFSDGMTEELITQLGGLCPAGLGVIARTSVNKFRKSVKSVQEIGRELDVDYIVEGSVRRADDRIRISAQLIKTSDQIHLWAESYERDARDILALQDEVARAITRQIRIKLAPEEEARLGKAHPVNPRAYESYLMGRYHFSRLNGEGWKRALACFEDAVAADPEYAPPFSGIADCNTKFGQFGFLPPIDAFSRAKAAALKAIALDESLAEAHASLGMIDFLFDWDWRGAEQKFERAIALNPNQAIIHTWYAFCLPHMHKPEEALQEALRGLSLEPLGQLTNCMLGFCYHLTGQSDLAIQQLHKTIDLHPESFLGHFILGLVSISRTDIGGAISAFQKATILSGLEFPSGFLGVAYAMAGQHEHVQALFGEVMEKSKSTYVPSQVVATFHMALGRMDQAIEWLDKALDERDCNLPLIGVLPLYAPLRPYPRFQSLLKRIGLPH